MDRKNAADQRDSTSEEKIPGTNGTESETLPLRSLQVQYIPLLTARSAANRIGMIENDRVFGCI